MCGLDPSLIDQIRVSERWMGHNDLCAVKDHIILTLFEYLKLQAQMQWFCMTSEKETSKIEVKQEAVTTQQQSVRLNPMVQPFIPRGLPMREVSEFQPQSEVIQSIASE